MARWLILVSLIVVLSAWHMHGSHLKLESHLLHQELFFVPIILAGFWYSLPWGLAVAILISAVYISSMIPHMGDPNVSAAVFIQVILYILIAGLLGWLTYKLRIQQEQIVKDEQWKSLTRLASALSIEIQEILNSLEIKHKAGDTSLASPSSLDFEEEIDKLKRLTTAFKQIDAANKDDLLSSNINDIVKKIISKYNQKAKRAKVRIITSLDEAGCPSMVISESIIRLIEDLVVNAIEASPVNSKVFVRSTRKGAHCIVEVEDEGPGVSQENISKLFTPLFSTKPGGHGLSLAVGKKTMIQCEGDLLYETGKSGGAIFKLIIPRENMDKNINGYITERI